MLKRLFILFILAVVVHITISGQATGVYAEAVGTANLRASHSVESPVVGEIRNGVRYPVVGRSEFYPWVLVGDTVTLQPLGWVFQDLVTVYGDLFAVPVSTLDVSAQPTATFTPLMETTLNGEPLSVTASPTITPNFSVYGVVQGEINIRYEPRIEGARLGVAQAGDRFEIVGYHTQFPWVQIRYENAPQGLAWVSMDVLDIQGDIYTTRPMSITSFNLPTLTPTAAVLGQSSIERDSAPVPLSPRFAALGNRLWNMVLEAGFDPATSRFGAMYLHNLQTGEEIVFGNRFAFSGTSINKIAILMEVFGKLEGSPDVQMAMDIANTMICSENVATNRLLSYIGDGNDYVGAENLTGFLQEIGLRRTFLTAPYLIPGKTPEPPPFVIRYPKTDVDQQKANPNVTNQMTVDEMGHLLSSIYQCAYQEDGALMERFPGMYTPQECRKMIHVMANNTTDAMLKTGVPAGMAVSHKHGWVDDTHGNAAIIFTPGGDYVMVMMLFQPTWLDYNQSFPLIAESSRLVYNYFNPDEQLSQIRDGYTPPANECSFNGASPVVLNLMSNTYGLLEDTPPLLPTGTP